MGVKVLLVEDNPLNRRLVRDILEYRGHHITEAETADDAIKCLRTMRPDIILLDIQIPGGGGERVLREVRGEPSLKDLPVVAVTAFAMAGDAARLLAIGFDGYVSKPIDAKKFGPEIESYLKG
jgi:CheY-like chemotaxis protein